MGCWKHAKLSTPIYNSLVWGFLCIQWASFEWSTSACIYKQTLESLEGRALSHTQAMISFDKLRAYKATVNYQNFPSFWSKININIPPHGFKMIYLNWRSNDLSLNHGNIYRIRGDEQDVDWEINGTVSQKYKHCPWTISNGDLWGLIKKKKKSSINKTRHGNKSKSLKTSLDVSKCGLNSCRPFNKSQLKIRNIT